jgi:NADH dehydrogenase
MKVALFGGTGFVGGYLVDELLDQGHEPVVLVRPGSADRLRQTQRCGQTSGEIGDPKAVRATLAGCHAAIYNIGILREFPKRSITYQGLHFEGAKRSMDLAQEAGVRRYLLMSANGVKADGTGYQQTKHQAEQYLQTCDLDWTIFRPSVVFGDPRGAMEFATQLERDLINMPIPAPLFHSGVLPLHAGTFGMSPVHVQDVARAFAAALSMPETIGQTYALGGPECLEWKRIIQIIAAAVGTSKLALPAPAWAVRVVAGLLDRFEFCPITRDQLDMLLEGNCCGPEALREVFHIEPTAFSPEALGYLKPGPVGT